MLIKEIVLAALGLICGGATSAGTFALITSVGVVPRLAGKSSTAIHVMAYENAIIAGGITGNILSTTIYLWLISLTASKELSILLLKLLECR